MVENVKNRLHLLLQFAVVARDQTNKQKKHTRTNEPRIQLQFAQCASCNNIFMLRMFYANSIRLLRSIVTFFPN